MKATQFAKTNTRSSKPIPAPALIAPPVVQSSAIHYEEQPGWGKLFGTIDTETGEITISGYFKTPEIVFNGHSESFSIRFTGKPVGEDGRSVSLIGRCTRLPGVPIHLLLEPVVQSSKDLKVGTMYIGKTGIKVGASVKEGKTSGQFYRCLYTPSNAVVTRCSF